MMQESPAVASSFMKAPRAHYRVPCGRTLGAGILLLMLALLALFLQNELHILQDVSPQDTMQAIVLDLSLLLIAMSYAVAYRATLLWRRARDGVIGTRMQSRIIVMFSVIAIMPTLLVAGFSILIFNLGVKSWFDNQVISALQSSLKIAAAYVQEHKESIRNDALAVGHALQPVISSQMQSPATLVETLSAQSVERNLSEAVLFNRSRVLARTALSFSLTFERMPEIVLQRADSDQVAVFGDDQDKIQAVMRLSAVPEIYLLVSRVVDPAVLQHMKAARASMEEYEGLRTQLDRLKDQFFLVFLLVALLVLLMSLWAGMLLAMRLAEPLRALIEATERVREGDFMTRVPEGRPDDEVSNLGRTFNRMTEQLHAQRAALLQANQTIDARQRLTEAVLLGVSAGVLAVDRDGLVRLHNRAAEELLAQPISPGQTHAESVLPGVGRLIAQVSAQPERAATGEITLATENGRRSLHVRVGAEQTGATVTGYVVTCDDMTALIAAQRSAAWADVAQRIAHEIKNPLTPITLSAERLRKKFAPMAEAEREAFDKYLDTIARHTRDIGRMVEEFVGYARLPAVQLRREDLAALVRRAVFSAQTAHAPVQVNAALPAAPLWVHCDEGQLGQALLNLLKNAAEALDQSPAPQITLNLSAQGAEAVLVIADNGPGFPPEKLADLMQPYVTSKARGTGLGLAIVKRTIEEHKGTITLSNAPEGGARVRITLPQGQD